MTGTYDVVNDNVVHDAVNAVEQANEQAVERAATKAVAAVQELGVALTDEGLFRKLAEMNGPLEQERDEQAAKAQTLRESHAQLAPRVAAQSRLIAGEIDRAFAEGRDNDAEAKRAESGELERNLADILAQAQACEQRAAELAEQQQKNSRTIFEETYPSIRESTVAVEIALVKLLDKVWADLQQYGAESSQPLLHNRHLLDLTPYESGPEKIWFTRLREWFGGRR